MTAQHRSDELSRALRTALTSTNTAETAWFVPAPPVAPSRSRARRVVRRLLGPSLLTKDSLRG